MRWTVLCYHLQWSIQLSKTNDRSICQQVLAEQMQEGHPGQGAQHQQVETKSRILATSPLSTSCCFGYSDWARFSCECMCGLLLLAINFHARARLVTGWDPKVATEVCRWAWRLNQLFPLATPHTLDLELGMETELMKVRWLMAPLTSTPAQKYKPLFGDGYPGDDSMRKMKVKVDNFHTAWVTSPWLVHAGYVWHGYRLEMVCTWLQITCILVGW